ncbi:DNA internalization-related competence protein ComEC/Rec2 [Streptococcus caviae]|uniref:DNA internalization-related competence protein ComEC/Rec2 n=1 Tax=Streptococcus sp. 'caviae' TaxID=1915004 RepID=UPI00094BC0F5|nr:DNA internalization-related competence protein ComEC/Rec2 [Streptococcus sp. 'caviae']OLN84096.1 DNA internalization-related competence protein ComEC/Rec2 [Streptococcus sp. 'caviae']
MLLLRPIYLAFLTILIYFLIYRFSFLTVFLVFLSFIFLLAQYDQKTCLKTFVFLLLFGLYFYLSYQKIESDYQNAPKQVEELRIIPDTVSVNGDSLSFQGKSGHRIYQAFYTLKSQKEKHYFENLWETSRIKVSADLTEADSQRNFGGFDYRSYLKAQKIYRLANVRKIERAVPEQDISFFERLHEWRRRALVFVNRKFPAPMRHYMTGLLFGYLDKSFDEMSDIYSSLGIIHLFALSGMQVGFFIGNFRYLGLRLGVRRDYMNWLQLPFSLVYAGLTGFSVSVVRSLLQKNLSNFGLTKMDNFAVTLFTMFFIMPHFLLTAGGVLSFAYAFILGMADFQRLSQPKRWCAQMLALTLGILPLLMWYFSSFQPLSVFLTALFSLIFDGLILPVLTIAFFLSPFILLTNVNLFFIVLERLIVHINQIFSRPFVLGKPSLWILVLILLALALLYDYRKKGLLAAVLSVFLVLLFLVTKNPPTNEVTVVDVGQGDSIFLRDIKGKTILIDVGGRVLFSKSAEWQRRMSDANAEKTLIPYLKSRGVSKIDQMVLTHTDADHIGDMEAVAKAFKIGQVLVSSGSLTDTDFAARLKKLQVKISVLKAGDRLPIMGSQLQVLYPFKTGDGSNDDSVVLYGRLLNLSFLFTGDLEKEGEDKLMAAYPNLKTDVLKAGHHGSKGASSAKFLRQIQPQATLISAGKNNRYRHPHQETLKRLIKIRSQIYRTDQQGALRFTGIKNWTLETVN